MSNQAELNSFFRRIQNYVVGKLREHSNQVDTNLKFKLQDLTQKISELKQTVDQQNAQISQLQTAIESARMWDARLSRTEAQITDLELWKKGAIAQINVLINLEYSRLDDVENRCSSSTIEAQRLAKQVELIKALSKPRKSWVDGADIGPLLDTHAETLPPSGAGHPNSLP